MTSPNPPRRAADDAGCEPADAILDGEAPLPSHSPDDLPHPPLPPARRAATTTQPPPL